MEQKFASLLHYSNTDLFEAMEKKYHLEIWESEKLEYATSFDNERIILKYI